MTQYSVYVFTEEEASLMDPFGHQGIRLDFPPDWTREQAEERVSALLADIPHVISDRRAWADRRALTKHQAEDLQGFWAELTHGTRPVTVMS